MPYDASYEQLMRLLATRGLEWLRKQVLELPDPLPADHPAVPHLSFIARIAPVLSGLRGHVSPLEDIVSRRLSRDIVRHAAKRYLAGNFNYTTIGCIIGGRIIAGDEPVWQLAVHAIASDRGVAPVDRLAAGAEASGDLLKEIEIDLCRPVPTEILTESIVDRFAFQIMQVYQFGASRPKFSHPRVYGELFSKLTQFKEWATRNSRLSAMCQIAYCLRLIDPDHDISDLLADVIAHQRPDGSFPRKAGYSTRDQGLEAGTWPTLMALTVLNFTAWRKWRGPRPDLSAIRPFTTSRASYAAAIAGYGKAWANKANSGLRLKLACGLSRATGENWFAQLGLRGFTPNRRQVLSLAGELYGDIYAARDARHTLNLARNWPSEMETGEYADMLRWLRGAPVELSYQLNSPQQPSEEPVDFDVQCRNLAAIAQEPPDSALKTEGLRQAWQALMLLEQDGDPEPDDAVLHLERLNRLVQIFESAPLLSAAA
ncbi:hypothetical protein [Paracoccus seriniphilus]|uniref:Uncharacterized protein n=1 Tax=Paracoccus seriniphilus TaxID=184748 RepID=A0A239PMQ6_9RHOB|nr:hypothetical protein [Paracoccus seriniphilus]WCR13511.1 hypothetical protein JHW44_11345 [Paracoccus seriniphilus]SNT68907.1 hypothetical protein SAMN05444959_101469 [Paracoccus seriniphilus]